LTPANLSIALRAVVACQALRRASGELRHRPATLSTEALEQPFKPSRRGSCGSSVTVAARW
jgi:hypothetical protein